MFYDALLQVGIAVNMSCSSIVSSLNFWEFSVYSIALLSTEPVFCLLSCFQRWTAATVCCCFTSQMFCGIKHC